MITLIKINGENKLPLYQCFLQAKNMYKAWKDIQVHRQALVTARLRILYSSKLENGIMSTIWNEFFKSTILALVQIIRKVSLISGSSITTKNLEV